MELQFFGANCLTLATKNVRVVVDDNLGQLDAKPITKNGDAVLATGSMIGAPDRATPKIYIDGPGEYEVSDISITGIAARGHTDELDQQKSSTMYKLVYNDIAVLVTGHVFPELDEKQLENIGEVDVMFVPVGGNGYTLDATGALELIKTIEPKLVVPTHYNNKVLKFEVPQQPLEAAIKELGMEPKDTLRKLKIKPNELMGATQLLILEPNQ